MRCRGETRVPALLYCSVEFQTDCPDRSSARCPLLVMIFGFRSHAAVFDPWVYHIDFVVTPASTPEMRSSISFCMCTARSPEEPGDGENTILVARTSFKNAVYAVFVFGVEISWFRALLSDQLLNTYVSLSTCWSFTSIFRVVPTTLFIVYGVNCG